MKTSLKRIELDTIQFGGRTLSLCQLESVFAGGNKYFKLKRNLAQARAEGHHRILSFGGAWSNHIHALSIVGKAEGFETIGVIRGERASNLSATLVDAETNGMRLKFVSRSDYREKTTDRVLAALQDEFGDFYLLPEGGTNDLAVQGCGEILGLIDAEIFDLVCLPVGTGGTMAGIVTSLSPHQACLGFSVMKGNFELDEVVAGLVDSTEGRWQINHDYHCGGYAKCPAYLKAFILDFEDKNSIALDPVYTGKLMFGLSQMLEQGDLDEYKNILVLHTGGRQGRRGFTL